MQSKSRFWFGQETTKVCYNKMNGKARVRVYFSNHFKPKTKIPSFNPKWLILDQKWTFDGEIFN